MSHFLPIAALLGLVLAAGPAVARDDQRMYPLESVLNSTNGKAKIDPAIQLFFGAQTTPQIASEMGEWGTNKKTNGFNKTDQEACEWTFLSAVMELQERARQQGGNAVVGIKSNYKSQLRSSESEYMCGSGALMSGVALKGKVVKLAP